MGNSIGASIEGQKRLNKITKKMNKTKKEVLEVFQIKYHELQLKGVEQNLEKLAINAVMTHFRREVNRRIRPFEPKAKATALIGFRFGGMGFRDEAEEIRKRAKAYVDREGLDAARDKQLINGDNQVLDSREKVYGRENPNYLEPLGNIKIRRNTLIGFFRKNGDNTYKYTAINTNDNQLALAWKQVPNFEPCQTFGIVKEDQKLEMKVNSSKAEETTTVFKAIKEVLDINKIIMDTIGNQFTPIGKVTEHHEAVKNAWDRRIYVRAVVLWVNPDKPTRNGGIWMSICSGLEDDDQVRVLIPKGVAVDFGEGSEVIVIGRTFKFKDRETKKPVDDATISAYGVWPVPGMTTPKASVEEVEDEDEIDGWLTN